MIEIKFSTKEMIKHLERSVHWDIRLMFNKDGTCHSSEVSEDKTMVSSSTIHADVSEDATITVQSDFLKDVLKKLGKGVEECVMTIADDGSVSLKCGRYTKTVPTLVKDKKLPNVMKADLAIKFRMSQSSFKDVFGTMATAGDEIRIIIKDGTIRIQSKGTTRSVNETTIAVLDASEFTDLTEGIEAVNIYQSDFMKKAVDGIEGDTVLIEMDLDGPIRLTGEGIVFLIAPCAE